MSEVDSEIDVHGYKRKKQFKWFIVGSILALICFVMASCWSSIINFCKEKTVKAEPKYNLEDFKRRVKEIQHDHDARNRELYEEFCRDIANAGEEDFQKALNNIDDTVAYFGKFKTCAKLIFSMTRDKIKGTNETSEFINEVINADVITPCYAGRDQAVDMLNNFIHKLQENDNRLRAEIAVEARKLPQNTPDLVSAQKFMDNLANVQMEAENLAAETAFTALGVAIEVIMIRQTVAMLGRFTGRVIAKVSASAAAPLLDGPLPIGDVISVIGLAWCMWDIYKIKKVIPRRMGDSLYTSITNYRDSMRCELRERGQKLWELSNQSSAEILQMI